MTTALEERAREWLTGQSELCDCGDYECHTEIQSLTALLTKVQAEARLAALEEIVVLAKEHFFPSEPFVNVIRALAQAAAPAKETK